MLTPPWDPTLRPDIAILIALPEEFRTIAADYSRQWYPHPNPIYFGSDFLFFGPRGYRCMATIMPSMGPKVAGVVSMRLLELRPATIINIGIAGGIKSGDICIGDVIVPRQIDAYDESGKIEDKNEFVRWQRRGSDYRTSADLVADVRELEFAAGDDFIRWASDGAEQLNTLREGPDKERIEKLLNSKLLRNRPILSTNHLASGSFVIASASFAEFIREANADRHAGEMEAAGMMAAAEYRRDPPRTLVVRGISDHIDADKREVDAIGEGALRRLAMANAWRLVCMLMRLGRLPRAEAGSGAPTSTRHVESTASPTLAPFSEALRIWQEKLAYLLSREPITIDHDAKFSLQKSIEEARGKIRELGGSHE